MTSNHNIDKIITESDSKLVINSIRGLIMVLSQIDINVMDIVNLVKKFDNIDFNYCNRS